MTHFHLLLRTVSLWLLGGIGLFCLLVIWLNLASMRQYRRHGVTYTLRNLLTDWSLVVSLLTLTLREAHGEGIVHFGPVVAILLALWPWLFVYWFFNLRHWTGRRYPGTLTEKEEGMGL